MLNIAGVSRTDDYPDEGRAALERVPRKIENPDSEDSGSIGRCNCTRTGARAITGSCGSKAWPCPHRPIQVNPG